MEPHRKRVQTYNVPDSDLIAMRDPWGASYFGYDALARMTARLTPNLDAVYYAYDPASNLVTQQYPRDGASAYFGYDAAQRLVQLASPAANDCYYEYDEASNVTRKTLGNGVVSWAAFDEADRMVSLRYAKSDGTALAYFEYARDIAGHILRIGRESDLAIYYSYDAIDRLEAEVWRRPSDNGQIYGFWYEYDAANNRLAMRRETAAGLEWDSSYFEYNAANEMLRRQVLTPPSTVADTYFYYDNNGSLTERVEDGAATYFAYGGPKLVSAILPPGEEATYFHYDAGLSRFAISQAGTLTYWLWDGLNPVEQRDAAGDLLARFTNGYSNIGGIGTVVEIERHAGGATYFQYLLADHRGTAHAVADQDEEVQLAYTLDAFGRELAPIGGADPAVPNDLIYQTNWLTLKIGGKWYGVSKVRVFDPELGIFLSRDPLPALNKYRAFSNDPVSNQDPLGLQNAYESYLDKDYWGNLQRGRTDWKKDLHNQIGGAGRLAGAQRIADLNAASKRQQCQYDRARKDRLDRSLRELQEEMRWLLENGYYDEANRLLDLMDVVAKANGNFEDYRARREGATGGRTGAFPALQHVLDGYRGVLDALTLDITKHAREFYLGENGKVKSVYGYGAGYIAGTFAQAYLSGGSSLLAQGYRVANFGRDVYQATSGLLEGDYWQAGFGALGAGLGLRDVRRLAAAGNLRGPRNSITPGGKSGNKDWWDDIPDGVPPAGPSFSEDPYYWRNFPESPAFTNTRGRHVGLTYVRPDLAPRVRAFWQSHEDVHALIVKTINRISGNIGLDVRQFLYNNLQSFRATEEILAQSYAIGRHTGSLGEALYKGIRYPFIANFNQGTYATLGGVLLETGGFASGAAVGYVLYTYYGSRNTR